jgi:tetratricopeptide (TPR) repeat protein
MHNDTADIDFQRLGFNMDVVDDLVDGQVTLGQLLGINGHELYKIAEFGHQLFLTGKLEDAERIFNGLIAADPYDSVFQCQLATIYQYQNRLDLAIEHYTKAIRLNLSNIDALAARGETYLVLNQIDQAVTDLKKAIELDPKQERPSTKRAQALLLRITSSS